MKYLESIGKKFIVIDSKILLDNPRKILLQWCNHLGIEFDSSMLKWDKGNHPQDGIWWQHWYDNVINSTGFNIYRQKDDDVPSKYLGLYDECIKIYDELAKYKIT